MSRSKRMLIDWLRFTTISNEHADLVAHFGLMFQDVAAVGFYNTAIELHGAHGAMGRMDWHTEHPSQRCCYTFSGADLDKWRAQDKIASLIAWAIDHQARFTRVDFAVDILNEPEANVLILATMVKNEIAKTNAGAYSVIQGVRAGVPGTTLYVGSRQSEKFMRIYDKAAEQGIEGHWVRVELECKGDYAAAIAPMLLRDGDGFGLGQIKKFCTFPGVEWYEWAMAEGEFERVAVDRTPGKRREWQDTILFAMTLDAVLENEDFADRLITFLTKGGFVDKT